MQPLPLDKSVALIPDGASLMIGGFMGVGTPERVIDETRASGEAQSHRHRQRHGACRAWASASSSAPKLVRKAIVSHIGLNPETQKQMIAGELEVELVPQGTLIERIRAGGFGLGGILTPTGIGTLGRRGQAARSTSTASVICSRVALRADFALVQAFLADYLGNLSYALTARNFNPVIAMAADTVIVDADHIVPVGVIAPDHVMTPAPLVDYLVANREPHGTADHHRTGASRGNCAPACWSISASGSRRWSRTIVPAGCTSFSSPRTD